MEKADNVVIAAAGTGGGHVFPAQALALALLRKRPAMRITFVGSGLRSCRYFQQKRFAFVDIPSQTPFKKRPCQLIRAWTAIVKGVIACVAFFKRSRPGIVIGFGSFHTFPALVAAWLLKVPIILFESNLVPGRVNRWCSRWAQLSAVQFPYTARYLSSKSICVNVPLLGMPEAVTKKSAYDYFQLSRAPLTVLIFGGSQGSVTVNRAFDSAMQHLQKMLGFFQVIHILGRASTMDERSSRYENGSIRAVVKAFERRMDYAWTVADLAIVRAGGMTLAESIAFNVPAIFIPYPYSSENHQWKNARFISQQMRSGVMIEEKELTGQLLAQTVVDLTRHSSKRLRDMKRALWECKRGGKKRDLAPLILEAL